MKTTILLLVMFSNFKLLAFLWDWPCSILSLFIQLWIQIYISNLIRLNKFRGRQFHNTFRYIHELCALNHTTFLDLDISVDKGKFTCKMFEKRDAFNFLIARMWSYINDMSYIPLRQNLRESLGHRYYLKIFWAKNLSDRMINQGGSKARF